MEQLQPFEMVVTVYPSPRHDIPKVLELPTTAVLAGAHQFVPEMYNDESALPHLIVEARLRF